MKACDDTGNFIWGECFLDIRCRHGHPLRFFNIRRAHYVACDRCRSCTFLGLNLMSSWQYENEDIWQANHDRVKNYRFTR